MYTYRQAIVDDLDQLLKFEQELIQVERGMDPTIQEGKISYYNIANYIEAEDTEVLVATLDNTIVASGYARIKTDRHYLQHDLQGHLGFMYVVPEHRGKGLNAQIIDRLITWCAARNVHEIRLDVYEDNPSAIRAYEKVGFKKHMIKMRLNVK